MSLKITELCASKCLTSYRNEEITSNESKCAKNCFSKYLSAFEHIANSQNNMS